MKIKNSFKVYIGFILILFSISNLNATEKNYYQDIVNDWNKIFPDKNRNAAGPKFFKYIFHFVFSQLNNIFFPCSVKIDSG